MQYGRAVVYTDVPFITMENVIDVLKKGYADYQPNISAINFLFDYEAGEQPLTRVKKYRSEINAQCVDNIANEITEFKTGFIWGNPITFIQRGREQDTKDEILQGIATLNKMYEAEGTKSKRQHLARNVEITGLGYEYIDLKIDREEGESYFEIESIDPRMAFVIRSSYYADKRPMLGVLIRTDNKGIKHFTAFSKDARYEISQDQHEERSGELNPLGAIPVIEWIRDHDRMGCFERQISEMDNLNLLISDFTNDVEQNTQAIWHTNDVDFPMEKIEDAEGNIIEKPLRPKGNEWLGTYTSPDGKTPFIKPLSIDYDYTGMLQNIITRRSLILQKCNVPQRNDNSGGSTGIAMASATGYEAAEASANKQQNIMESCAMEELKVVLKAIKRHPNFDLNTPLGKLTFAEVAPNIKRQKTYELSIKVNSISTLISHGFALEDAVTVAPLFEDPNEVVNRSGEGVRKYQEANVFKTEKQTKEEKRPFPDYSDQEQNSPNLSV